MEKFLAEAQTSYFWIFALFTFIVGLFVNYSMKPIDAVMGTRSRHGGLVRPLPAGEPPPYGYNEADTKAIQEAAARANKSKGRRR